MSISVETGKSSQELDVLRGNGLRYKVGRSEGNGQGVRVELQNLESRPCVTRPMARYTATRRSESVDLSRGEIRPNPPGPIAIPGYDRGL